MTPGKDTVEEYDFAEYREREGHRMLENGETALRCDVCGAEFFVKLPSYGTLLQVSKVFLRKIRRIFLHLDCLLFQCLL